MLLRSKARNNNALANLSDHEEDSESENTNNNINVNQLVAQAEEAGIAVVQADDKVVKIKVPKVVQLWEDRKEACIFPGTKGTAAALKLYHVPTIIFHEILVESLSIRKFNSSPLRNELRAKYIMKKLYEIFGKRLKFYRGLTKHKDAECVVMKEKEVQELTSAAGDGPLINYIEKQATKTKSQKFLNELPTKNPEVHQEVMAILEHGVDEHAAPNSPAGNSEGGDVFNPESPGNSEDGGDSEGEADPLLPDLFRNTGGGGAEEEEGDQEEEEEEEYENGPGGFDDDDDDDAQELHFDTDEEVEEPPNDGDGGGDDEFHDALDTLWGGEDDNDVDNDVFYEVDNNNPPHHQLENNGHNNNINMSANNVGNINKRKGSGRKLLSVARIIGIIITSSLYFFVGCRQSLSATSSAKDSKDASVVVSDDANKDDNFTNRTLIHLEDETAINIINNVSYMGDSSSILNISFTAGGNGSSPPSNGCSSYVNSPFVYTGNNLKNEAPRMKAKKNARLALSTTDYFIPDISLEFTEAVSSICISGDLIQNSTVEVVMPISDIKVFDTPSPPFVESVEEKDDVSGDDTRDNGIGTNEHPVWVWYITALAILLVSGISVWVCFLFVDTSSTTSAIRGLACSGDAEKTKGSSPSRDRSGLEWRVISDDLPVLNVGTSNRTSTITGDTPPRDQDRGETWKDYFERVLRLGHPEVEMMQS